MQLGACVGVSVLGPYDFVIGSGSSPVDKGVNDGEAQKCADCAQGEQFDIGQGKDGQQPGYHVKGGKNMNCSHHQRQEENQQDLSLNTTAYFLFRHTYLTHDFKAALIFKAFGNLFVVDDEHGGQQKEQA